MNTRKKIILATISIFVLLGVGVLGLGLFPVARVNGQMVWYRDMRALERATTNVKAYVSQTPSLKLEWNDSDDTRKAVLGELIIREVMKSYLDEFGREDIERNVAEHITKIRSSGNVEKTGNGLEFFYKMDYPKFERLVIKPQLVESALRERVEQSGKNYTEWLKEKGKEASVKIYFLPYRWQEGMLENT